MRFGKITDEVSVQFWQEYVGKEAYEVYAMIPEGSMDVHFEEPRLSEKGRQLDETLRIYFEPARLTSDPGATLYVPVRETDPPSNERVRNDFYKIVFQRESGARAVCFRFFEGQPSFTGFGRIEPGGTVPCNQDYSETYVDHGIPGNRFINYEGKEAVWSGFEPVWLKVQKKSSAELPAEEYVLKVWIEWIAVEPSEKRPFIKAVVNPDGVPPELAEWQFNVRRPVEPGKRKPNKAMRAAQAAAATMLRRPPRA